MNEILECIKLIKMCSWEKYLSDKLLGMINIFKGLLINTILDFYNTLTCYNHYFSDLRKKEQNWLHKIVYFQSFTISLMPAVPIIAAIVTFLAHLSSGNNLIAAQVYINF